MVSGFGDLEMQRDISVAAKGWSEHIGNRIDTYIKSPLVDAEFSTNHITSPYDYTHSFDFARYTDLNYIAIFACIAVQLFIAELL